MPFSRQPFVGRDSRVLVFSQRNMYRPTWHALQYEFEDLLLQLDDVSLVSPAAVSPSVVSSASRRLVNGALRHSGRRRRLPPSVFPSMRPIRVDTDHDLFFAVFHHPYQLSYLNRLEGWRDRSTRAACLLLELWSPELVKDADYLQLLREFDHVYVFNPSVVPALARMGVRRPTFMPAGVDALMACPLPDPPERCLDVYTYGRTSPDVHAQLLTLVRERRLTYLYDTSYAPTVDAYAEHRELLANMMMRADFFLAHRINDSPERRERTGGDEGMSTRYFEGAAGGAVLLGSRIPSTAFDECFDWEDAVVDLPYEAGDVTEVIARLAKDPDRMAKARANNVANSLSRHDWMHRWARVLEDTDLPRTPAMHVRSEELTALADSARPEAFLPGAGSAHSSQRRAARS